mmetsp:Transcript_17965/g.41931  ORF Transcript_17965/g.41931 Transcript_17965/m.41931 type:complete len:405 (-) Transcript_17965:114-1328(-)|eukprot:CAMPEP_0178436318 /NCGR_PEP_ID=MMETSP0689_2-20121128/34378_1 /TAXON_ID=160604 /ORGANISM="Amphidinium massartii, Strain CS-259" /LENGTH=404 /DNA_ID=CAMNT_0020058411 /DNA_START=74 /DNA_END=1288 /DNA_ORIENTATION=+
MPGKAQGAQPTAPGPITSPTWEAAELRYNTFLQEHGNTTCSYQAQSLLSLQTVTMVAHTVWSERAVWKVVFRLFMVSLLTACVTMLIVSDPVDLRVSRFADIVSFMRFFVSLLLGFFMAASVTRWWRCSGSFMELFDAVRNLQIQLVAMGVPHEKVVLALRYGVLSCWILTGNLEANAHGMEDAQGVVWENLLQSQTRVGPADPVFGVATEEEVEILRQVNDPAGCLWIWIGLLISDLSREKYIPPSNGPAYGSIMNIAKTATDSIRRVKCSINMQAPYVYVNMLASLVHLNNLMNAVSFGATSGSSISMLLAYLRVHPYGATATRDQLLVDMQSVVASFFFSCFGPCVYQALLVVAINIAQPFSSKHAVVPTASIIHSLEKGLHDVFMMNANIKWPTPAYKSA